MPNGTQARPRFARLAAPARLFCARPRRNPVPCLPTQPNTVRTRHMRGHARRAALACGGCAPSGHRPAGAPLVRPATRLPRAATNRHPSRTPGAPRTACARDRRASESIPGQRGPRKRAALHWARPRSPPPPLSPFRPSPLGRRACVATAASVPPAAPRARARLVPRPLNPRRGPRPGGCGLSVGAACALRAARPPAPPDRTRRTGGAGAGNPRHTPPPCTRLACARPAACRCSRLHGQDARVPASLCAAPLPPPYTQHGHTRPRVGA